MARHRSRYDFAAFDGKSPLGGKKPPDFDG
jgi:hypothetical protein